MENSQVNRYRFKTVSARIYGLKKDLFESLYPMVRRVSRGCVFL